jgi:hypothetical protein
MDAKRCDRCGCYYDNNGESKALFNNSKIISKNIPRTYGIGVCFKDIYDTNSFRSFDLCSDCVNDFIKWFEEVE